MRPKRQRYEIETTSEGTRMESLYFSVGEEPNAYVLKCHRDSKDLGFVGAEMTKRVMFCRRRQCIQGTP